MARGRKPVAPPATAGPEAHAVRRSLTVAIWLRVSVAVSALSAVNVVTHLHEFHELSESLGWLVGWWRFGVSTLFGWLHLHLRPITQDCLVLLGLALGVGNLTLHSRFGLGLLGLLRRTRALREGTPEGGIFADLQGGSQRAAGIWALLFIGLGVLVLIVLGGQFHVVGAVMAASALCAVAVTLPRIRSAEPLRPPSGPGEILLATASLPFLLAAVVFAMLSYFRRPIGWTAGLVALVLAVNALFVRIPDPIWPALDNLRKPPSQVAGTG